MPLAAQTPANASRTAPLTLVSTARAWEVTAIDAVGKRIVTRCNAADSFDAVANVLSAAKAGSAPDRKVSVRPLVEVTEIEGALRHPYLLHPDATCIAQMGWDRAEKRAQAADLANAQRDPWQRHDREALFQQQQHIDAMGFTL